MSKETVAIIQKILEPESIAVVGASEDMSNFGGWAIYRPMTTGFRGAIYPVNPRRDKIFGSTMTPPFAPPSGIFTTAVLKVIQADKALTSS